MVHPYDLGKFFVLENCEKINVNELVRNAKKLSRKVLLASHLEVLGLNINLIASKTQFSGQRLWFACPRCKKRVGIVYRHPADELLGCRSCLHLLYRKQRFKGMIEVNI